MYLVVLASWVFVLVVLGCRILVVLGGFWLRGVVGFLLCVGGFLDVLCFFFSGGVL